MFIGILLVFVLANQDFFEFEREYKAKGYEWEYVGRTPAEPGYPHLEVYEDGKPYYYYQLVKAQKESN
jgi:hypothetical protein